MRIIHIAAIFLLVISVNYCSPARYNAKTSPVNADTLFIGARAELEEKFGSEGRIVLFYGDEVFSTEVIQKDSAGYARGTGFYAMDYDTGRWYPVQFFPEQLEIEIILVRRRGDDLAIAARIPGQPKKTLSYVWNKPLLRWERTPE